MLKDKIISLLSHKGFQRYAANTSWLIGEKLLRMTMGLFVGIWVARYLGPEQFGLFSYAQSFTFLFAAITTLGLDSIVIRELVKDDRRVNVLMGTAFFLKLIGAFLLFPILFFAIGFTNNDSFTNFLIFIIASSTIFQSFNVIDFYCQSKVLSRYVAWSNGILLFFSSIIKVVFILNDAPLLYFVYVVLLDSLVLSLGLIYFYTKKMHLGFSGWRFDFGTARELLKDSWPLIFSGFVISIYMRIDQIMIKSFMGTEAVGQYSAALKLSEIWYFVPVVILSSVFPAIVNAKKSNVIDYCRKIQALYLFMVWFSISVAVFFTIFSGFLIGFLYGDEYSTAANILTIHIWGLLFVSVAVLKGKWQNAENLNHHYLIGAVSSSVINVALNYVFIPIYGLYGAAISTVFSQLFSAYLINYFFKELRCQNTFFHRAILLRFKL